MTVEVLIQRLDPELPMPRFARPGDAGIDLFASVDAEVAPGARLLVPTGISIALPAGYVALTTPRSGFSLRQGGTLLNSPGIIDAGYRGEIGTIVYNTDVAPLRISRGDRIAQLLIMRLPEITLTEVAALPGTHRADGGFGSTGKG